MMRSAIRFAYTLLVWAAAASALSAAPKIDVVIAGVPATVNYGDILSGAVTITLSGFEKPVDLYVHAEAAAREQGLTLTRRGNGIHKVPLSQSLPLCMNGDAATGQVKLSVSVHVDRNSEAQAFGHAETSFMIKEPPAKYIDFVDAYCFVSSGIKPGKSTLDLRYKLHNNGTPASVVLTESVRVNGPDAQSLPAMRRMVAKFKGHTEVTAGIRSVVLKKPGRYDWTITITAPGYPTAVKRIISYVTDDSTTVTPSVSKPKPSLAITKATINPQNARTGQAISFIATCKVNASGEFDIPVTMKSAIDGKVSEDNTQTIQLSSASGPSGTGSFKMTFDDAGKYIWRLSFKAPGYPEVTQNIPFTVTKSVNHEVRPGAQWWVCDKPIITTQDQYGNNKETPAPAGMQVNLDGNMVTFDFMSNGKHVVSVIRFTPPDLRIQEGWEQELAIECQELNPSLASFNARWYQNDISSTLGDPEATTVTTFKKPDGTSPLTCRSVVVAKPSTTAKPSFQLVVGHAEDSKRAVSIFWNYKKEPK